jgi:hypothetical protein
MLSKVLVQNPPGVEAPEIFERPVRRMGVSSSPKNPRKICLRKIKRGGVLLIPGLDATFAGKGRPDWMAITKDAVWVASSSVNHVVRLDAKTIPELPVRRAKTAIVTGASSGIGLELAKKLSLNGYRVVANSRRITSARTLTGQMR